MASQNSGNNEYVNQLIQEKKTLNNPNSHAAKLLQKEIDRVKHGNDSQGNANHIVVHSGKQVSVKVKVHIPVDEHPNFNFVGKLLGPKGSSLQQLQEATQTKMAILGKGSVRDKRKEEELRNQGEPKNAHLNEELHVEVSAYAPAHEAYRRVSLACLELQHFLVPDPPLYPEQEYYNDMHEPPQYMNDGGKKPPPYAEPPHMAPRPMPPRPMGPPMMQGRELPPPRRVQSSYSAEADEWATPPPRPSPRRGGYSAPSPSARAPPPARTYEEPAPEYNSYGDGYGEYSSGNPPSYYDYPADPEPPYADGYAEESRAPLRSVSAPRGRPNNGRAAGHPYAGASRRGY